MSCSTMALDFHAGSLRGEGLVDSPARQQTQAALLMRDTKARDTQKKQDLAEREDPPINRLLATPLLPTSRGPPWALRIKVRPYYSLYPSVQTSICTCPHSVLCTSGPLHMLPLLPNGFHQLPPIPKLTSTLPEDLNSIFVCVGACILRKALINLHY